MVFLPYFCSVVERRQDSNGEDMDIVLSGIRHCSVLPATA